MGLILFFPSVRAVEFELKQKFKSRDSITVNRLSDETELESKKKNRITSQTRFVAKFSSGVTGLTPYIQLGYEWEKSDVSQKLTALSNTFDESYDETLITRYIGAGLKYKRNKFLFADKVKFEFRYDYWFDMNVKRTGLGLDAAPLAGDYSGYEAKIKIEAIYLSPIDVIVFQPQVELAYVKVDAWLNELSRQDVQLSVEGKGVEARFLTTWFVNNTALKLSLGPEVVYDTEREVKGELNFSSESETVHIATFLAAYELDKYDLEFEFWFKRQLDGELRGENNLEFKVDWSF
jgi:hypothetical protein